MGKRGGLEKLLGGRACGRNDGSCEGTSWVPGTSSACVAGETDDLMAGGRSVLRALLECDGSRCCFELSLPMMASGMSCALRWFALLSVADRLRDCVDDFDMLRGCDGELAVEVVEADCPTALSRLADGGAAVAFGIVVGIVCALCRRLKRGCWIGSLFCDLSPAEGTCDSDCPACFGGVDGLLPMLGDETSLDAVVCYL